MADCGEDGVGGIAFTAFEIAAPEVTLALHVADHRLDRGTPSQLTFDDAEHATLLARDEDAVQVFQIWPRYPLSTKARAIAQPVNFSASITALRKSLEDAEDYKAFEAAIMATMTPNQPWSGNWCCG